MVLDRRAFLLGTSALGAAALGCDRLGRERYDLCVIGSGFAGTFLALRAVEHGLRTIVIDAGSSPQRFPEPDDLETSFQFTNSGSIDYPINATRAIAVGGASRHWGGVVTRLWPSDFRMRSELGLLVDWPISYEDLEPYYCEAERALAVRGYAPIAGAEPPRACAYADAKPGPYVPPSLECTGEGAIFFPLAHSRRKGEFGIHLVDEEVPRLLDHPLGSLLDDRQVTRIVTLDGKTVDHVEARGLEATSRRVHARAFVVAAGVVESARLLLLSRSSWFPQGLGNRRGLVGRHFNEHPSLEARFEQRNGLELPLGHHRTCSFNDTYRRAGLNASQFQLDVWAQGLVRCMVQPEIEPRYENTVTLSPSRTDAFDNALPDLHFSYSERDRRTLAASRDLLARAKRELGPAAAAIPDHDRWRAHPAGTCRMGADERTGVVDRYNRVFGVENLFVSGACTFPTSGTANPTNTVVALTLRLADQLHERLS